MTKEEVKWLFTEIRARHPTFMRGADSKEIRQEMSKWAETLPEGLCIGGAMEILESYSKPYTPNLADFMEEANSHSIDGLFWSTIRNNILKITRDEHLAICREEGKERYEKAKS